MNSKRELLHQLEDQNLSSNERAQLRCQVARQFEDQGDYEAARLSMGELWQRVGDPPLLEGLEESARLVFRALPIDLGRSAQLSIFGGSRRACGSKQLFLSP